MTIQELIIKLQILIDEGVDPNMEVCVEQDSEEGELSPADQVDVCKEDTRTDKLILAIIR